VVDDKKQQKRFWPGVMGVFLQQQL